MAASIPILLSLALWASPIYQPKMVDTKRYSESNTVIAWLSDGTYLQAQLVISNASVRGNQGACRVLMVRPGSSPWTADTVVERDGWASIAQPVPTLRVGPCKATASATMTTLDVQLEGTSISIALAAPAQPTPAPGYPAHFNDNFFETDVVVPFAAAEVVLEPAKGEAQLLKGFGYADHSRSTCLPKELMRAWVRFRGFSEKCSTIVSVRLPSNKKEATTGYWWRQGAKGPEGLKAPSVTLPAEGPTVPFDITIQSAQRPFTLRATELLYRDAPFESHGLLGRVVGAFVGRAVTFTYAATLRDPTCGDVQGVMELEWAGDSN